MSYYVQCPGCGLTVEVAHGELYCQQFVCEGGAQVNPHMSEAEAMQLLIEGKVYGCMCAFHFDGKVAVLRKYG